MVPETARALGVALLRELGGPVAVIRDTRESGQAVLSALLEGLGGEGIDYGVLPTPALSQLLASGAGAAGIAITASHNPWQDNGLKVLGPEGGKLSLAEEASLEASLVACGSEPGAQGTPRHGDGNEIYRQAILERLPEGDWLSGVRLVLDAAHGAAWASAPAILERLGADLHLLGCAPDGRNINQQCGAMHPEQLAETVRSTGAQAGIALDGDGDRCVMVDRQGQIVDGDALLLLLAQPPGLVGTAMCNGALPRALDAQGIAFTAVDVGDRNVAMEMQNRGWLVGGEPSGHVLLKEGLPTGDGLFTALKALAGGLDLAERLVEWRPMPQCHLSLPVREKPPLESYPSLHELARRAEEAEVSRVLLRYSGTEPRLRILVEAESRDHAQVWMDRLAAEVARVGLLA